MSHLKMNVSMQSILVPSRIRSSDTPNLDRICWRRVLADKTYDLQSVMLIQSLWTMRQYVTPHWFYVET